MSKPLFSVEERMLAGDKAPDTASMTARRSALLQFKEPLRYYFLSICIYFAAFLGASIWALQGPSVGGGSKVLRTGNAKVDQFYSGALLSVLLTPAAIVIRKINKEISALHPFAIAAEKHVRLEDLDRIMDVGPLQLPRIFRYSVLRCATQAVLMAMGAFLVPLATLMVTTGEYAADIPSFGVVGAPVFGSGAMEMSIEMGDEITYGTRDVAKLLYAGDVFLSEAEILVMSSLITHNGFLPFAPKVLGPIQTTNLTYQSGIRYENIVTFSWDDGCQLADSDIQALVEIDDDGYTTFVFNLDGKEGVSDTDDPDVVMLSNATKYTDLQIPYRNFSSPGLVGTTYYAIHGLIEDTVQWPTDKSSLVLMNGSWISRVKCTPWISWQISSCIWDGNAMQECAEAPFQFNSSDSVFPSLDWIALDYLQTYLEAIPWALSNLTNTTLPYIMNMMPVAVPFTYYPGGGQDVFQNRAPGLDDFKKFYGLIAESLVALATNGYHGTIRIPTSGGTPKAVYLVRIYILAVVILMLLLVCLSVGIDIVYTMRKQQPFRQATFLTVASAVRGPWWDETLQGCSTYSRSRLEKTVHGSVKFGLDPDEPERVGLGPHMLSIGIKE